MNFGDLFSRNFEFKLNSRQFNILASLLRVKTRSDITKVKILTSLRGCVDELLYINIMSRKLRRVFENLYSNTMHQ